MKRRSFIKSTSTLAASCILSKNAGGGKKDKQPNILFIMTDQQHFGMMSCTGNKYLRTPAMDSLANEGVRFDQAYSANPVCVPSRISMATGMMPGRLNVFANKDKAMFPDEVEANSLGKLMKKAGYDTFYGGKVHMCRELIPQQAGYDVVFRDSRGELPGACIEFITKNRDQPFFAVASFINPHDICYAHKAREGSKKKSKKLVGDLYKQAQEMDINKLPPLPLNYSIPDKEPEAIEANMSATSVTPAITMRKEYKEEDWRIYRWIYCRLTEIVDAHIGKILDALKEKGLEQDTLIIFTSDHGNMDASHKLASKYFFYEESARVPFIMKYNKGIPKPGVEKDFFVSTGLDILPTCCDYAGIPKPGFAPGLSLRSTAEEKKGPNRRMYIASEIAHGRMIRSRDYKYCVYNSGKIRESLVDMNKDPGELKNLAYDLKYRSILIKHRKFLKEWIEKTGDKNGSEYII